MSTTYYGYIYIWYDTISKWFYIGRHKGSVEDTYICSSKTMLRAYKKRPDTFRFRVLEYVFGGFSEIRLAEQKWLSMIQDEQLLLSENVKAGTVRYYNATKSARGGMRKGTKTNRKAPAWNRGLKNHISDETRVKMSESAKKRLRPMSQKSKEHRKCLKCETNFEVYMSSRKSYCSPQCSPRGGWNKGLKKKDHPALSGGRNFHRPK